MKNKKIVVLFVLLVISIFSGCQRVKSNEKKCFSDTIIIQDKGFEIKCLGEWLNVDENTCGTTKLMITKDENQWFIHGWGKCHPSDCDWGQEPLLMVAENCGDKSFTHGFAIWKSSFATRYMTLKIENNFLLMETVNVFKDNSGRSNYISTEKFELK